MLITSAQYFRSPISGEIDQVIATVKGKEIYVPLTTANRYYREIIRQVEAGELTIADAD